MEKEVKINGVCVSNKHYMVDVRSNLKSIFVFLLICVSFCVNAQFVDDFSDGDFSSNPIWNGETEKFQIASSSAIPATMRPGLQSVNTVADTSYIVAEETIQLVDSLEWIFWTKMSFNPTSGNFARVYLMSSQSNLEGSLNGYYVSLSYNGTDRLYLMRQDGDSHVPIISGTLANLNKSTNELRIKVRYNSGVWQLFADTLGGTNYFLEGSAVDESYISGNYLGVYCKYTASNASKFYFDDFYAGRVQVDTVPPNVNSIVVNSAFQIDVFFSETLDENSAKIPANYFVNKGVGNPSQVEIDADNSSLVHLLFSTPIIDGEPYKMYISNIKDLSGNVCLSDSFNMALYIPKAYDVVINEIMADPSPVVLLPEYEYVELYNTTDLPINLDNYSLKIGTSKKDIGNITIQANSYLILCSDNAKSELAQFGEVYSFSTFSITNANANISLLSPAGAVLSFAQFEDTWYNDDFKKDGGWSVEQIDPFNPCVGKENWTASNNSNGGSPGSINSVNNINLDVVAPELLRVSLVNDSSLRVFFSEPMDSSQVLNPFRYSLSHDLNIVGMPQGFSPLYNSVILNIDRAISRNIVYTLTISDTLTDCVGNIVEVGSSVKFAISDSIIEGDLVINEILSNPVEGVSDFVEIINRSNKVLDIRFLTLATLNSSLTLDGQKYIAPNGCIMFPGEIIALTKDRDALLSYYYSENPNNVLEVDEMPAYVNDEGIVVIAMAAGNIIDKVEYSADMHDPLMISTKGVSLERINYDRPSGESSNWHSAASSVGFATPAYQNSQYLNSSGNEIMSFSSEVVSPDNDGYQDVLNIDFSLDEVGVICNMQIFDSRGRLVKQMLQNESLGMNATITWNGTDDNNQKVPFGIYIVVADMYSAEGYSEKVKKTVVVGGKL